MVVHLTDADLLVILSDIDGLYTADPKIDPSAELIPLVEKITAEVERGAGDAQTPVGTGGMRSKLMTAKKVGSLGAPMVIVNGKKNGVLPALFERQGRRHVVPSRPEAGKSGTGSPIRSPAAGPGR
jgi:glutamate 5-kinase